mmetsp:Transcript_30845/g.62558  ORF Transcript_30845/g.62558 Transcript_30845/m.62558 type:complete len:117 (-) Transcript_30845:326-676(-)|eukprot:CAMPEP_0178697222 /NCGR_PEP_ID=MMETSP0699-20121125/9834_1 /TAXON_ID=265572 /ORGANISM="Extubocellulus spinifer, Strain CCMP396" /LENGTH=116 /DNA_ID=CAMNT_0020343093 /DNA_START=453 /DNA_END=799 /DNA_ORIENTATION=+
MSKHDAGNANRDHLTGRHDDGEDDGTEFLDGVVNEELSGCRGDGSDDVVPKDAWVGTHELEYLGEVIGYDKTCGGDADRGGIDAQHHLVRVDVGPTVLGVDLILPLAGEAIAGNVG